MSKATKVSAAVEMIPDGAVLMIGGFLGCGSPHRVIDELVRQGKKNLTIIANDTALPGKDIGKLIEAKLVKKAIVTHIGTNPETQRQMLAGETEVELVPQGTLAERIRAGGFGLGAVITPTGVGTTVEDGKKTLELNGKTYLVEMPLKADFSLVLAKTADWYGNLRYSYTMRNFNPVMAMAGNTVIAEAEEFVPVGGIAPDDVETPCVLVDYLVAKE